MVGVPGRSKGCITCRSRKKKCDQQKPVCANCIKGKFVCGGYHRDMIMVEVDPKENKGTYTPQHSDKAAQNIVLRRSNSPFDSRCRDLDRIALEVQCFDAYWSLFLPQGMRPSSKMPGDDVGISAAHWCQITHDLTPKSDLLRCTLLASSMSKVGQSKNDHAMIQEGMELYGQALTRVAAALKNPSKYEHSELIATCRLLVLYEKLNSRIVTTNLDASVSNWHRHVIGTGHILRLRPPEYYAESDADMELFLHSRFEEALSSLAVRRASFLSKDEWMTKPWTNRPKTAWDKINDILLALPTICEMRDCLADTESSTERDTWAKALLKGCKALTSRLQKWYEDYCAGYSAKLTADELNYLLQGNADGPPKNAADILVTKCGLRSLIPFVLYCSTSISLDHEMKAVCCILYGSIHPQDLSTKNTNMGKFALCNLYSMRYFLGEGSGLAGASFFAYGIACIAQYLTVETRIVPATGPTAQLLEVQELWKNVRGTAGCSWIEPFLYQMHVDYCGQDNCPLECWQSTSAGKVDVKANHLFFDVMEAPNVPHGPASLG